MIDSQPAINDKTATGSPTGPGLDSWLTPSRFAAILGILIVSCFPQVVGGFETFYYRDFSGFGYPLAFYHKEAFWRFEMPLWNPFSNSGMPFTAQWNTLTLYPLSIFYLLFPLSWSLGVFCLGHLFLAGMGMYFLAYRWTGNRFAAAVAGAVFAFNGLTWHSLMWPNNIAALGWMPWVVWLVERSWRVGGRGMVLAALAGAMQMLSGAPEVIAQTWVLLGVLWLVQIVSGQVPRGRMVLRAVGVLILVSSLAAAQLLPFLDLLSHSQRDKGFADAQWAMPLSGWVNYLVPLFRPQGGVGQTGQYWTSSYYLGIGTVLLALIGIWHVRGNFIKMLIVLAAFSLCMAMGDNAVFYPAVKHIFPQIGFMRFPIKFVVMVTFAVPLIAASGVNWIQNLQEEDRTKAWKEIRIVGAVLLGLIIITIWSAGRSKGNSEDINLTIKSGFGRGFFLVLILGWFLMLQRQKTVKMQRILQVILLILLWMDVFTHSPNLNPTVSRAVYAPDAIRDYMKLGDQLRPGASRAMLSLEAMNNLQFHEVTNAQIDVSGRRLGFFGNYNLLDHASKFDGFYSLDIKEYKEVVDRVYLTSNSLPKIQDFLGISLYSSTNGMDWTNRNSFLPMITAGQKPLFADGSNAMNAVFDEKFAPAQVVYLPTAAKGQIQADNPAEVTLGTPKVSAQHLAIEVDAKSPAMVVVAQAFYHPWQAFVDGQPIKLWRANYAFQALEVPSGHHHVEIVYKDRAFQTGAVISLLALLSCVAAWFMARPQAG
ncbi:YfhO family protein [Pedosphaera parvula]|uniref:YfhO family protein n=1 Tax=Pedosphaera parvula (strain Ellin514) TaxID=320771 RepID=B9XNS2_PEDPL|nr:YfhO family protein [Pedosphaera parvula]EEF58495.1 hypothetical protein Cflav_PD1222 [Pedosphaera parvula Ellin514]